MPFSAIAAENISVKLDYRHCYSEETKKKADRLETYISADNLLLEFDATMTSNRDSNFLQGMTVSSYDMGVFLPLTS